MANHKSAWKRIRQNVENRARNIHYKTMVRNRVRQVLEAIDARQPEEAKNALVKAMSVIQHVATKGTLHRNTAARKIARLSRAVHKLVAGTSAQ